MVSLAEKMAANMDMSAFSKAEELKKRLWFTVLALIVFRLGRLFRFPASIRIFCRIFSPDSRAAFWECSTCFQAARWSV